MRMTLALLLACALLALTAAGAHAAQLDPAPLALQEAVERAVARVTPALVRIHVVDVSYRGGREVKSEAVGSGVIFTEDGHVITNHHVAGRAKQIVCTLATKEEMDADRVGTDPLTDICVLKLRPPAPRRFATAPFGDSDQVRVGDRVLAMGSPLALSQSVTMGIVSNTAMVMPEMLWPQRLELEGEDVGSMVRWIGHDARISQGNSGGPLVSLAGEIVGVNEIIFGLGGAIPGNLARATAERLLADGAVPRAWLGLGVQPLLRSQRDQEGVLVSGTVPGSPAEAAGFQPGDVLVSLAGRPVSVTVPEELPIFNQYAASLEIGRAAEALVLRGGQRLSLQVTPDLREPRQPWPRELGAWGITARDLSLIEAREMRRETRDGVLVTSVRPGGPGDEAKPKLLERDVIVAVAGRPVRGLADLDAATEETLAAQPEPAPVLVSFDRRGERYLTVVRLGRRPEPIPTQEVRRAWLGAETQVLTQELAEALGLSQAGGVRVTQVLPGSPAEEVGLQVGDLLLELDGHPIPATRPEHLEVFPALLRQRDIGAQVRLRILRDGQEQQVAVALAASPPSPRELRTYHDEHFEFTVRDLALEDRARQQLPEHEQGALVVAVSEGSWAALGQLAVGDLIVAVDERATPDRARLEREMQRIVEERPEAVVFHVRRGIHHMFIELQPKWGDE